MTGEEGRGGKVCAGERDEPAVLFQQWELHRRLPVHLLSSHFHVHSLPPSSVSNPVSFSSYHRACKSNLYIHLSLNHLTSDPLIPVPGN